MRVAAAMEKKLTDELSPERLEIVDESYKHSGHSGARASGESHFNVEIVSAAFEGKSRVERQRLVYGALAEEMKSDIHALSLQTISPSENI